MAIRDMKVLLVVTPPTTPWMRVLRYEIGFADAVTASDGATALAMLRSDRYDLVIADWAHAPMPGLDLLRAVRSDRELRDTPFIMVLDELRTDSVVALKEAGVSNIIPKPFSLETIRAKIFAVLGR